jgi:iron complex outermembrane receptor protein
VLKGFMVKSGLIAFACSISFCVYAIAETPKQVDVPAGDLGAALQTISKQAGVELVFRPDQVRGLRTEGVSGTLSAQEAVRKLLEGTPLQLRMDEATGAMMIGTSPAPDAPAGSAPPSSGAQDDGRRPSTTRAGEWQTAVDLEEVLVTGTHIRGADNPTAPLIVMDRKFIDSTGLATTVQLIESLPQNFALVNQSAAGGAVSGNSFSTVQGASVNLRGVGEGTTLILVNGRRMPLGYDGSAVNIAALPLSAIERVEVLTDGASALYGSDAVGGVVNFVFRKDFEGAETRARYGHADSVDERRLSQVFGKSWQSGNFVVAAEHYARDMLLAEDRDFGTGETVLVPSLMPEEQNTGLTLFGRQNVTASVDTFLDVLYTDRDSYNRSFQAGPASESLIHIENAQLSAAMGLGWNFGSGWRAELSGGYGKDDLDVNIENYLTPVQTYTRLPIVSEVTSVDLKADGAVFDLPGGTARIAVGTQWREEQHAYRSIGTTRAGVVVNNVSFGKARNVGSLFAEGSIPLIGEPNARRLARALTLSLAVRYDDYSDFGSSVDPRVGLAWTPIRGLKLRGSWGSAYLAPKLKDYYVGQNGALAIDSWSPANDLNILQIAGNAPESLKAQEATNYTFGADWAPAFLPGASFALNYYDIDYRDKIESFNLTYGTILGNLDVYGPLVTFDPTVAQVNEFISYGTRGGQPFRPFRENPAIPGAVLPNPNFDPAAVDVIFDLRRRNIGVLRTRGVDFSAAYDFAAGGGDLHLGVDIAWIREIFRQVAASSAPADVVDTFGNPTHLRLRAGLGYRKGGWSFSSYLHRKNAYTDNRFQPYVGIDHYTTVDVTGSYRFGEGSGVLSDASVTLSATNLLDEEPPTLRVRAAGNYDQGFDTANASPLGRLLSLDLTKRW